MAPSETAEAETPVVAAEPLFGPGERRAAWIGVAVAVVVFLLVATGGTPWHLFDRAGYTSDFYDVQARALVQLDQRDVVGAPVADDAAVTAQPEADKAVPPPPADDTCEICCFAPGTWMCDCCICDRRRKLEEDELDGLDDLGANEAEAAAATKAKEEAVARAKAEKAAAEAAKAEAVAAAEENGAAKQREEAKVEVAGGIRQESWPADRRARAAACFNLSFLSSSAL